MLRTLMIGIALFAAFVVVAILNGATTSKGFLVFFTFVFSLATLLHIYSKYKEKPLILVLAVIVDIIFHIWFYYATPAKILAFWTIIAVGFAILAYLASISSAFLLLRALNTRPLLTLLSIGGVIWLTVYLVNLDGFTTVSEHGTSPSFTEVQDGSRLCFMPKKYLGETLIEYYRSQKKRSDVYFPTHNGYHFTDDGGLVLPSAQKVTFHISGNNIRYKRTAATGLFPERLDFYIKHKNWIQTGLQGNQTHRSIIVSVDGTKIATVRMPTPIGGHKFLAFAQIFPPGKDCHYNDI